MSSPYYDQLIDYRNVIALLRSVVIDYRIILFFFFNARKNAGKIKKCISGCNRLVLEI